MYKTELRYGLVAGALLVGTLYLEFFVNFRSKMAGGFPSFIGVLSLVFIIVYTMRSVHKSGPYPTVKDAFLSGMVVSCVGGILFGLYSLIYVKYIDPAFAMKAIEEGIPALKKSGISDAQIKTWSNGMMSAYSPFSQLMSGMGIVTTLGAITSLITAAVLMRKKK